MIPKENQDLKSLSSDPTPSSPHNPACPSNSSLSTPPTFSPPPPSARTQLINYYKNEVLVGVIVAFVLVTQEVAYAFIGKIEPSMSIHSAWIVGLSTAVFGGRPGMINGFTGGLASIIAPFISKKGPGGGIEFLFPSTILAGALILLCGIAKIGKLKTMLPSTVKIGFCNGLAIIIAKGQTFSFKDPSGKYVENGTLGLTFMYAIVAAVIFDRLPKLKYRIFKILPSSLIAILFIAFLEFAIIRPSGFSTMTLGDVSPFSSETAFPHPFWLKNNMEIINKDPDAAAKVIKISFSIAAMSLMETIMTKEVVNDFTKTTGDLNRQFLALGISNMISGFLGSAVGGAMLGISTINCVNGGRGRISSFISAFIVMILIFGAYPLLNYIPIGVLIGMMLIVIYRTFKWWTIPAIIAAGLPLCIRKKLKLNYKISRIETSVIIIVTVMTVTIDLLIACLSGIIISGIFYAFLVSKKVKVITEERVKELEDGSKKRIKIYRVEGPLFYGTKLEVFSKFDIKNDPENVQLHFTEDQYMDYTFLEALSVMSKRYEDVKKKLKIKRLSETGKKIVDKANDLIKNIEWLKEEEVELPDVPHPHNYGGSVEVKNIVDFDYNSLNEEVRVLFTDTNDLHDSPGRNLPSSKITNSNNLAMKEEK